VYTIVYGVDVLGCFLIPKPTFVERAGFIGHSAEHRVHNRVRDRVLRWFLIIVERTGFVHRCAHNCVQNV
jgi:hypothetical protein